MKGSNRKKKNYLVILLIVFLLALAVGYAAFSDTLLIDGTASANGTFDMQFDSCTVTGKVGVTTATGVISEDKDTLTVTVTDLAYPGAGAQFDVVIKNVGTIPAKIKAVTPTNITGSTNIKISGLDAIDESHDSIPANGTCNLSFTVQWDAASTAELTEAEKEGIDFDLEIEYEQDTSATFEGSASHTDANATV